MRELIQWLIVCALLSSVAGYVLRPSEPARVPVVEAVAFAPVAALVPYAAPVAAPPPEDPRRWCEPVDPPPCLPPNMACPARNDWTPRVCVREWWVPDSREHVCITGVPERSVQRWRANRLRVIVDAVCKRSDGCDPEQLHDYLAVLALRESSWRPYAVHRLAGDVAANARAWERVSETYKSSPAYDEPWRWQVGRGYFGQNAAYLLEQWDASAVPEVLCGEVEATLVHLRTARERWRRLAAGVTCDGDEHHGTASSGRPSWYDISLVNSGSDACPGSASIRAGFERRAESRGLDPYGRVTLAMLGRDVSRAEQDAFAARLRAEMDRHYPAP